MAFKYLYIDDNNGSSAESTSKSLNATGEISVDYVPPKGIWEDEISNLEKVIPDYQGLLLDLRLDEIPNPTKLKSRYSGTSVAQEIRTLIKNPEKSVKDLPIVLISSQINLENFLDSTGKDLFDYFIQREELTIDEYPIVITRLSSLSKGYELIAHSKTVNELIGLDSLDFLDSRLLDVISEKRNQSIHLLAGFILKSLILKSGPLLNERVLAARLGIDITKSGGAWAKLLEQFDEFKYNGVFAEGWNRWWMLGVLKFWKEKIQYKNTPRDVPASIRVKQIEEKLGIAGLVAAEKAKYCTSENFWTICCATQVPIDTSDGFIIANPEGYYPWQDFVYICPEEALSQLNIKKWKRISASENIRLEALKAKQ